MRHVSIAVLAACGSPAPPPPAAPVTAVVPAPDAALPDAAIVTQRPEPPAKPCIPRGEPSWSCPQIGVAAAPDGNAIVCFREHCTDTTELGCMTIEPRTGRVVGTASWPARVTAEPALPSFELFAEGRTIAVCHAGTCNRIPDALPVGTSDLTNVVVNAQGTQVFVLDTADSGITYSVATHKRIARFHFEFFGGPPPPTSEANLAYFGRGILLGDFDDAGIYERAIDPVTGLRIYLDKPWLRLPNDLVVHFDAFGDGEVELYDFDAHLQRVARRKASHRRDTTEGATAELAVIGDNGLVVTQDPPATLFVDTKARTIGKPRPLPWCPAEP